MSLLAKNFREKVSKSKDYKMKVETEFSVGYSTGFLGFDFTNGTVVHTESDNNKFEYYSVGIVDGSMNMVIGRSGCGKTTWCTQSAANIIRPFKTSCIFHDDIEGGIIKSRTEMLTKLNGEELSKRYITRNTGITAENFYERVKMIYDLKMEDRESYSYDTGLYDFEGNRVFKLEPTVYILDSLALLMPEKYTEEDDLSGQMSATAAAKTNAMIFKRVIPMLKSANIILFIINHINQKVDINPMMKSKSQVSYLKQSETLPGGNAPIYLSNNLIRFDDHTKLSATDGFGINGTLVDITLVKSRTSGSGKSVTLVYDQNKGFDEELSLLHLLKTHKRINGAGAFLYIGDRSDHKFSQKKFKEKLRTTPEFRQIFMDEVKSVLVGIINNSTIVNDEEYEEIDLSSDIMNDMNSFIM